MNDLTPIFLTQNISVIKKGIILRLLLLCSQLQNFLVESCYMRCVQTVIVKEVYSMPTIVLYIQSMIVSGSSVTYLGDDTYDAV